MMIKSSSDHFRVLRVVVLFERVYKEVTCLTPTMLVTRRPRPKKVQSCLKVIN